MSHAATSIAGIRRSIGLKPADTSEATMFTAGERGAAVVGIIISNNTGGAIAATVRWGDGSTDYDIYAALSVAANASEISEAYVELPESGTVKVTSATGNALTFTLTVVEYIGALGREHAH